MDDMAGPRPLSRLIVEATLDDLMRQAVNELMATGVRIEPSRGPAIEVQAVTLELADPRARLSRTENRGVLFSSLGELSWYLAGSADTDFISYYIADYPGSDYEGGVIGAYGPRLFGGSERGQVGYIIDKLADQPDSRRALIQIFDQEDVTQAHDDVPCTCTLQFLLRSGQLHAIVYMRSNDVRIGLPHDVFCFTMIHELIARSLDVELGRYVHVVGSLHFYEADREKLEAFIREGWQSAVAMRPMPAGNPWESVEAVLEYEQTIRIGGDPRWPLPDLHPYWQDLCRVFQAYALIKAKRTHELMNLRRTFDDEATFGLYIDERIARDRTS